jgi:hypothetical protein
MPPVFQVPELTFERADPVFCIRYVKCKSIFIPGTILQSICSEKTGQSYDLCPECWESYNTKHHGERKPKIDTIYLPDVIYLIAITPEMVKKIQEINNRRLPSHAAAEAVATQRSAPIGGGACPTRNLVIEKSISAAQHGVGEAPF